MIDFEDSFADRMNQIPRSFVREILKVTTSSNIISFAGGLPHPQSFPVKNIKIAASKILEQQGDVALQYSTTEGYEPLRKYIASRYSDKGLDINPDEILITNGSQQCLDLVGKVFINPQDKILVERPTYLAAIQAFSLYEPNFLSIPLTENGVDTEHLAKILSKNRIKLFYTVPNFQNPTGISYSYKVRQQVSDILKEHDTIIIEDDPYGEIRFMGNHLPSLKSFLPDSIMFGTISKIVSPGMRLGWIIAPEEIMEKLIIAKQASDLHSNIFSQRIVCQYLQDNDMEDHINKIRKLYKKNRNHMITAIEKYFPSNVEFTRPEGGMFIWVTLPENVSSMDLFELAIKEEVAFVPGIAFYSDHPQLNTLRLNFSNSSEEQIEEGIKRLGIAIKKLEKRI
jgi:2-aminoadipate transaminase